MKFNLMIFGNSNNKRSCLFVWLELLDLVRQCQRCVFMVGIDYNVETC